MYTTQIPSFSQSACAANFELMVTGYAAHANICETSTEYYISEAKVW
jgi:hypothetical protein